MKLTNGSGAIRTSQGLDDRAVRCVVAGASCRGIRKHPLQFFQISDLPSHGIEMAQRDLSDFFAGHRARIDEVQKATHFINAEPETPTPQDER